MGNTVQQVNWFFAKVILGIRADREFITANLNWVTARAGHQRLRPDERLSVLRSDQRFHLDGLFRRFKRHEKSPPDAVDASPYAGAGEDYAIPAGRAIHISFFSLTSEW